MIELLLVGAFLAVMGYIWATAMRTLNPFYMVIASFLLLLPLLMTMETSSEDTSFKFGFSFCAGAVLRFVRYLPRFSLSFANPFMSLQRYQSQKRWERKQAEAMRRAEENLHRQKETIEEEFARREAEFEDLIRKKIEELRRREEELKRQEQEQGKARQESAGASGGKGSSSGSAGSGSQGQNEGAREQKGTWKYKPMPKSFSDACKVLGLGMGLSFEEYRTAFNERMKKVHDDCNNFTSSAEAEDAHEEAVRLTAAWSLIKKKFGKK